MENTGNEQQENTLIDYSLQTTENQDTSAMLAAVDSSQKTVDPQVPARTSFLRKFLTWVDANHTIIILALSAFLLVEMIWGIAVVSTTGFSLKRASNNLHTTITPLSGGALFSMDTQSQEVQLGATLQVAVMLETGPNNTDGATAIIIYDPKVLQVSSVTPGMLYKEYVKPSINEANGRITITGIMDTTTFFTGKGEFAKIIFTAIGKGATTIAFAGQPSTSNETAVAANGKQVLGNTSGIEVKIR